MSELISNPQSESEPQPTGPSGHIADAARADGITPASWSGMMRPPTCRISPTADRAGEPDAGDLEETRRTLGRTPDRPVGRIRAILAVLVQGLLALSWACLRAAYRYPRWALAIVLSVVILGARRSRGRASRRRGP